MTMHTPTDAASGSGTSRRSWRRPVTLLVIAAGLTVVAELIGGHEFDIGIGTLTLLPLIWGILLGAAVGLQKFRPLSVANQRTAALAVQVGVLLLATRLAFIVGENVQVLFDVGPALLLQEIGNLFTIFIALPVAVLLGMGRAAIGATHSICREGSFVIIGERFGAESDERRGVLAMYVFGTVFGALWVGLLASILAGIGWFNPLALAMGSGVGSGSMMAASSNAVAAQYPELTDQILALAAVSNLLSSALGLYVGVYIAVPLANKLYGVLTRGKVAATTPAGVGVTAATPEPIDHAADATPASSWTILGIVTAAMLVAVWTFGGAITLDVLPGFALIVAITAFAMVVHQRLRISSLVVAMTATMLLASPWSPVAGTLVDLVAPINFLPLTTPVLVLAGLGLAKDAKVLRHIGWRVVPVGLLVFAATFVASALIAQLVLSL